MLLLLLGAPLHSPKAGRSSTVAAVAVAAAVAAAAAAVAALVFFGCFCVFSLNINI